jgi:hypothetical protein
MAHNGAVIMKIFKFNKAGSLAYCLIFVSLFCSLSVSKSVAEPVYRQPEKVMNRWIEAVKKGDFGQYLGCLHPSAQKAGAHGSREEMRSWREALETWRDAGFTNSFKFVVMPGKGPDSPPEAALAFPLLANNQLGKPARLRMETGVWRIESLPSPIAR